MNFIKKYKNNISNSLFELDDKKINQSNYIIKKLRKKKVDYL